MTLYIYHKGDPSVGINSESFSLDVPFEKDEIDDLEYFRSSMLNVYKDFFDFKAYAQYDFELKAEAEAENEYYKGESK